MMDDFWNGSLVEPSSPGVYETQPTGFSSLESRYRYWTGTQWCQAELTPPLAQESRTISKVQDVRWKRVDDLKFGPTIEAPPRKLLGCQTTGQCFCTGRCKRTAEEQAAHEAAVLALNERTASMPLGRTTFEPKPGHGPACTAEPAPVPSALDTQVGGDHYKTMGEFQPWSVLQAWLTPEEFRGYMKGTAIAYLARERQKGGDQDVSKATHTLQGLIEMLGAK